MVKATCLGRGLLPVLSSGGVEMLWCAVGVAVQVVQVDVKVVEGGGGSAGVGGVDAGVAWRNRDTLLQTHSGR